MVDFDAPPVGKALVQPAHRCRGCGWEDEQEPEPALRTSARRQPAPRLHLWQLRWRNEVHGAIAARRDLSLMGIERPECRQCWAGLWCLRCKLFLAEAGSGEYLYLLMLELALSSSANVP